jgi:hypothetical protein
MKPATPGWSRDLSACSLGSPWEPRFEGVPPGSVLLKLWDPEISGRTPWFRFAQGRSLGDRDSLETLGRACFAPAEILRKNLGAHTEHKCTQKRFFSKISRRLPGTSQNICMNFRFHFHPLASPGADFLKRRFFGETKSFVSFRFAPAIPEPRRAQRTYTHLLTHTHPHAHLTAIPAFPDAGG